MILNLQVLRFFAALLVIIAHSFDLSQALRSGDVNFFSNNVQNFGAVGVDIFFVISGYIITLRGFIDRQPSASAFISDRISRVVPIYWLLSLPWIAMGLHQGKMQSIFVTLTFWPAIGGEMIEPAMTIGWTLCFEMLFYIAATFVISVGARAGAILAVSAFAIAALLLFATDATPWKFVGNPIIIEFLLGVAIAIYGRRVPRAMAFPLIAAGAVWLAGSIYFGYGSISEFQYTLDGSLSVQRVLIWGLPSALLVLGSVISPNWGMGSIYHGMVYLGGASYSLYLIHKIIIAILKGGYRASHADINGFVILVIAIAVSTIAGALTYSFLEQPLLSRIRRKKPLEGKPA